MLDRKVHFLTGQQVYLRPVEDSDLPLFYAWMNDPEVRGLTGEVTPRSFTAVSEYIERLRKDESRVWFVIVLKENDQPIGECGLLRMFPAWRTTDLSIILGEKSA